MSVSPRQVIVDDNDSSIVYSPNWTLESDGKKDSVGNFGPTLKSTLHGTNNNGTFTYRFSGTQITVYGTTNVKNSSSGFLDPSWDCLVDSDNIGSTTPFLFQENNRILCSADNLTSGTHTLTVQTSSQNRHFWFDYLQYTPSNNDDFDNALVMVPRTDPAIIYDDAWEGLGDDFANMTRTGGSTAKFHYTGGGVTWYGVVPSELPGPESTCSYSIDGGAAQPFVLPGLKPHNVTMFNQMFFQTPALPFGPHTLTVIFNGDQNSTPLSLLYLSVQNSTREVSSPSTTSTSSPIATAGVSTLAVKSRRTNVAAIVCGVLAAVLLLCIFVFVYLKYVRKNRRRRSTHWEDIVKPFCISRPPPRVVESASLSTLGLFGPPEDPPSQPRPWGHLVTPKPRRRSIKQSDQFPPPAMPQPILEPSYREPDTREQSQASGSRPTRKSKTKDPPAPAVRDLDEDASYYGGYQTWGQTKALEAASAARSRDSYL